MARFYGEVQGSRGAASRLGGKAGMKAHLSNGRSRIAVEVYADGDGKDAYRVVLVTSRGEYQPLAEGLL